MIQKVVIEYSLRKDFVTKFLCDNSNQNFYVL